MELKCLRDGEEPQVSVLLVCYPLSTERGDHWKLNNNLGIKGSLILSFIDSIIGLVFI